jgi:hypothetical protein
MGLTVNIMNKTGTFWCWLFGHKFISPNAGYVDGEWLTWKEPTEFCVRCGIDKNE